MARIEITSPDAERIAKSFRDLIGPKGVQRGTRKAVNAVGADVRKRTRSIGPEIFGTSAAALRVQGKAASPSEQEPAYRLRMAAQIPIAKLRAKHRRASRVGGRTALVIDTPATDPIRFRSVLRVGRAFMLRKAGPLPARFLGGVRTRARLAFARLEAGGQAALHEIRKDAERDLPVAVEREILAVLNARKRP